MLSVIKCSGIDVIICTILIWLVVTEVFKSHCPSVCKESVEGADTVLRGSGRASEGFSESKPKVAKPRGRSPRGFAVEGLPEENPEGALALPRSTVSAPKALF